MSALHPILFLEQPSNEAINWVVQQLTGVGLEVVHTFNLKAARHDLVGCPCPYHGTEKCDCQMAVMLVYGNEFHPISLVAHSYDGRTWILLVDSPQQRASPYLEKIIRQALPRDLNPPVKQSLNSHASFGKG